jgi:predicted RNA binding protein YcfA (HicA-like mRNA interferase family)
MAPAQKAAVPSVPMHKPLKRGTLRSILRTADIEVDVFVAALRR